MKNFVLNGAMNFDQNQEGGIYYSAFNEVYSLDQWRFSGGNNGGNYYLMRAPFPSLTYGFKYCLQVGVLTQQETLQPTDNFHIEYPIEGCKITPWSFGTGYASNLTLSFYIVANQAGDYSFALMNGQNTRSYVTSFTVTTANVVEKIVINIPGDTEGTWSSDIATFGAKLIWSLGVGSVATTPSPETWVGAAYWNKADTVQLMTCPHNTCIYLFGVQLEMGDVATDFEHLDYAQELLLLQRYYYKTFPQGVAVGNGKGLAGAITYTAQYSGVSPYSCEWKLPVQAEGYPVPITTYNPVLNDSNWYNVNTGVSSGVPSTLNTGDNSSYIYNPQVSTDNKGNTLAIHAVIDARMGGS